jgi:hypothetical protein
MVPTRVTDKGGVGYPVVQGDRRAGAGRVESVTQVNVNRATHYAGSAGIPACGRPLCVRPRRR